MYSERKNDQWDLVVYNFRTKTARRITYNAVREFAPVFRPDGGIVFASEMGGRYHLFQISAEAMRAQTYEVTTYRSRSGSLYAPQFSGDVAFVQKQELRMREPARSSFAAAKLGDRIYVAGGHKGSEHTYPPESFVSAVEYYDLNTKRWQTTTPLSVARQGFEMVAYGRYLYVFGGFTYSAEHTPGWKSLDLIERYDPAAAKWEVVGHMPRKRSSHVAALVGSKVYLIGGWDSTPKHRDDTEGRFHPEIDVYDLATGTSSTMSTELPQPLRRALSAVEKDGRVVLIGGISEGSSEFSLLDKVTELDPATETWRELHPLPFPTFAPAAGLIGDSVFVFGGMLKVDDQNYNYVRHIYGSSDLEQGFFHTGRYVNESKGFSQVVELDGDTLGILGGHTYEGASDHPVQTFETFSLPPVLD